MDPVRHRRFSPRRIFLDVRSHAAAGVSLLLIVARGATSAAAQQAGAPQEPQVSGGVTHASGRAVAGAALTLRCGSFSVDGRRVGMRYDTNQLPLGQFFVLDAEAAHSFGHGVELFAAAQNLFNATYAIAAGAASSPQNDGAPITGRIGLRFQLGRH
jgi:hypothetical protein